jgi:uncharacterized protein YjdB
MRNRLQVALAVLTLVPVGCSTSMDNPTWPTPITMPTVSSVSINGYSGDITGVGHTVQLRATAHLSNGTTLDVTNTASWASDATGVARVSSSGLVTSVSAGDATITATDNGVVGRQRVTVRPSA